MVKLRVLECPLHMLNPEDTDDESSEHDEPLDQGYYRKKDFEGIDTAFDVRSVLPESLQELYMTQEISYAGLFHPDCGEWPEMASMFNIPNASTPNLSLDKTCIRLRLGDGTVCAKIGNAEGPSDICQRPLAALFTCYDEW